MVEILPITEEQQKVIEKNVKRWNEERRNPRLEIRKVYMVPDERNLDLMVEDFISEIFVGGDEYFARR